MSQLFISIASFRACLHGGGGPHVGEVTRLSIKSLFLIWSRLNNMGGVTRHMLPHICGVPHLHVNRPLLNWAVIFMFHTNKWKLSLLQTPLLRTVSLVPNTASFIQTLPSYKGRFPSMRTLDFVSFVSLRVAYSLSDVTTRKLGRDFGWLIVQSFALLCIFMSNCRATVVWFSRIERLLGVKKCWQSLS